MTKLYNEFASGWYQLFTPLEEYKAEADIYQHILEERMHPVPKTILELGCGAGHVAFYLKEWYMLTLSDMSESMLSVSKRINPACKHYQGDMRTLRLEKTFDVVFIHDAIMYMTTKDDLRQAMQTAFIHCNPGGATLISPDFTKETFTPSTDHGGEDADGHGLRYVAWTQDPDPDDDTYTVDYAYIMRNADGSTDAAHDHHVEGLFGRSTWFALLEETGFEPQAIPDSFGRINFLGYKPLP